jgi:hypothetical protein
MTSTGNAVKVCLQAFYLGGLAIILSGCDPIYGVEREAILATMPDPLCVKSATQSTAGVSEVKVFDSGEQKDIFGTTIPRLYQFAYKKSSWKFAGVFSVSDLSNSKIEIVNRFDRMGEPPPQPDVDTARPLMFAVEKSVAAQCGVTDLPVVIKERCTGGITCAPL